MEVDRDQLAGMVRTIMHRNWETNRAVETDPLFVLRITDMLLADADEDLVASTLAEAEDEHSIDLFGEGGYDSDEGNPPHYERCARALVGAYHTLLLSPELRRILEAEVANGNTMVGSCRGSITLLKPVTSVVDSADIHRVDFAYPASTIRKGELYHAPSGGSLGW